MTASASSRTPTYEFTTTLRGRPFGSSGNYNAALYWMVHACQQQRQEFEEEVGLDSILAMMESPVAASSVESSIDAYRNVIRQNIWHFPMTEGVLSDVSVFLSIWQDVHSAYFELATEIFRRLMTNGLTSLATPDLYSEVIRSETARGWVGKRSPIGPDKQIERRASRVEALLSPYLTADDVDLILDTGGGLPGTRFLRSAEEDIASLLADYVEFGPAPSIRDRLLRDYSKYSLKDLEAKLMAYQTIRTGHSQREPNNSMQVDALLNCLPLPVAAEIAELLDEIRALNFLNLNLEPRFSFKSWAGLMHGLVFGAVRDLPGMSHDVYRNFNSLKEHQ